MISLSDDLLSAAALTLATAIATAGATANSSLNNVVERRCVIMYGAELHIMCQTQKVELQKEKAKVRCEVRGCPSMREWVGANQCGGSNESEKEESRREREEGRE